MTIPGEQTAVEAPGAPPAARAAPAGRRWLAWGAGIFAASVALYVAGWAAGWLYLSPIPLDLQVYVDGGMIVRHVLPLYDPHAASPLYDFTTLRGYQFTYTPFAAVAFALVSLIPYGALPPLAVAASLASLAAILWLTLHALGYRGRVAAGAALLGAGVLLWTEPVQRTLLLGQINLILILAIMVDLCLPWQQKGWWRGIGIGIAAGIKLVPLVFVPYLLLTRRYREAVVASVSFAATVGAGFAALPHDSWLWWVHGLFARGTRAGFPGVMQNQSLRGIITRTAGSVAAGAPVWLVTAAVVGIAGIGLAAYLHRAGQPVLGILACALTGLLISPISWDHHWVWIAPGLVVLAHFAIRAWRAGQRRTAAGLAMLTAGTWIAFAAWPVFLWIKHAQVAPGLDGLLWAVPNTDETVYEQLGDQRGYVEYHYHLLHWIGGNLYILIGVVLFALLAAVAVRHARRPARRPALPGGQHA